MKAPARSPLDKINGLAHFPSLLDKIRLHARGELREDLPVHPGQGADTWCCGFLHDSFEEVKARVLIGGADEEILEWCQTQGLRLNETEVLVWNAFITKPVWNDFASARRAEVKAASGLAVRVTGSRPERPSFDRPRAKPWVRVRSWIKPCKGGTICGPRNRRSGVALPGL